MQEMKYCGACETSKPRTKEFFFGDKTSGDGFGYRCKQCHVSGKKVVRHKPKSGFKLCPECKEEKELTSDNFHKHKRAKDGFKSKCKECRNKSKREYKSRPEVKERIDKKDAEYRNRPEIKAHYQEYRDDPNNKQKAKGYNDQYYIENTEKIKERVSVYAHDPKNKEKIIGGRKRHYKQNKTRIKIQQKIRSQTPRAKEINNKRQRERRANDPLFKVTGQMRNILSRMMKTYDIVKSDSTQVMMGYTPKELQDHLNTGVYTLEDYMKNTSTLVLFHLDHIIPLDYYKDKLTLNKDKTLTEEGLSWFRKANSLRNLRVWPAELNMSKHDDIDMDLIRAHGIEDLM